MEIGQEQYYSLRFPDNIFDQGLLKSTHEGMLNALRDVEEKGAGALTVLDEEGFALLLEEARKLSFRTCLNTVGAGEKAVTQDFKISLNFPDETRLDEFAAAFERQLNEAFAELSECPVRLPYHFNDRAMLIYEAGSTGISPHKDHKCFEGVVAILTLTGSADFYICDDRDKRNSILLPARSGVMIMMRGANYLGMDRPFHYVENITEERYGFGLRFNAKEIDAPKSLFLQR
ncbi:hypothetical protein [Curvivirga sp.]|uniref:hypothetical protein n=1 Tax=Curvivirga sp. TaxID=2856848 RepID=UPI003B59E716